MIDSLPALLVNPFAPEAIATELLLLILATAAIVDAIKGRIPDVLSLGGLLLLTIYLGETLTWPDASLRLLTALGTGLGLWLINEAWFKFFKKDAIGMGDAKWTALATAGFGLEPTAYAWVYGAWIALVILGFMTLVARLRHKEAPAHIHFAPALFLGLLWALK